MVEQIDLQLMSQLEVNFAGIATAISIESCPISWKEATDLVMSSIERKVKLIVFMISYVSILVMAGMLEVLGRCTVLSQTVLR